MVDIPQQIGERKNLALHVDMCVLRYRQIIRALYALGALTITMRISQTDAAATVLKFIGMGV